MNAEPVRPIRRLLVANRAEIASRIFRCAHALGIQTVAVYSTVDRTAPYVGQADLACHLPGVASADTYLDGDAIIAAARRSGADAIHPGYGFLSENPDFAQAVIDAGLTWVGPAPASIRAMALKVQAKQIAAAAGLPLAPGATLPADLDGPGLVSACADVGYPLLIKASAGGGGKGMHIVRDPAGLVEAVAAARRQALSAFGDDTVFAERYLPGARHVEVQVFGDLHGNVVHCFERECSIQRRHQKVIEEAPARGITDATRTGLLTAATSLARTIDYVGAGTVEFLVFGDGSAQQFCFLEMNTRLQVEHPVTEAVTGIDLVAWQLAVAQGEPLPRTQEQIRLDGHAIEARLYAEDPAQGFLPAPGRLLCFGGTEPGIRLESGVTSGSVITAHYDPMLAKVIAHGPDAPVARSRLARALRCMHIHGPVTNRDALVAVLEHPGFAAGTASTAFLDEHPQVLDPQPETEALDRHVLAATFAWAQASAGRGGYAGLDVPPGWRNVPAVPQWCTWQRRGDSQVTTVRYRRSEPGLDVDLLTTQHPPGSALFTGQGRGLSSASVRVIDLAVREHHGEGLVEVEVDGLGASHRVCLDLGSPARAFVDDGLVSTTWTLVPDFATAHGQQASHHPLTPVPGTVTAVQVAVGEVVQEGQTLVLLEAMKMEHRIRAAGPGRISRILVGVGDSVDAHQVVIELAGLDDD